MVSVPTFDPNLFVNGISQVDYNSLTKDPNKPLYNRALRGVYPPGSTVKPLIGLAGLETGFRTPQDTVFSSGVFYIPGQSRGYRDDQRGGVGRVALVEAIEQSVNTYFYKLALDMGIDRLSGFMSKFGFGKTHRDRSGRRILRRTAVARVENGDVQQTLVPGRDGHRRHRSGLLGGHAIAAGPCHRDVRWPRNTLCAAPGDGHAEPRHRQARGSAQSTHRPVVDQESAATGMSSTKAWRR